MSERIYVIWSYEHKGWWKPNRWGYTSNLREARKYNEEEIKDILGVANYEKQINEVAIPMNCILEEITHDSN